MDVLLALEESGHLETPYSENKSQSPISTTQFHDPSVWNDNVKQLSQLYSNGFEYSSDEDEEPPERNPMGLIEWLRRNQPTVFTLEAPPSEPKKAAPSSASPANAKKKPGRKRKTAGEEKPSKRAKKEE